jgi:hypothetical protein
VAAHPRLRGWRQALLLLSAAGACAAAGAQDHDGNFHDGRWSVVIDGSEAGYRSASVEIRDFAGFWRDTSPPQRVKHRACAGKRFPVTVQRNRVGDIEFMVWGSSVSPDCPDLSVLAKPEGARVLLGSATEPSRAQGQEPARVRLTRTR